MSSSQLTNSIIFQGATGQPWSTSNQISWLHWIEHVIGGNIFVDMFNAVHISGGMLGVSQNKNRTAELDDLMLPGSFCFFLTPSQSQLLVHIPTFNYWEVSYWLVVWNMNFIFPYIYICILATIIPTDELIFFRGVGQPPTSHRCCLNSWEIQTLVGVSGVTSQICWSQICWESGASSNWYTAAWWLAEPWATRGTRWRLNSAAKLVYTSN